MKTRGLTMIETLMALALLAVLVSGGAVWLSSSIRVSERIGGLRGEAALESVFTRIHEDLLIGDFEPRESSEQRPPRIRVLDDSLEIDTREGTTHLYRIGRGTDSQQALVREERIHGSISVRRLLGGGDVREFSCAIDDDNRWLDVGITMVRSPEDGTIDVNGERSIQRRYRLR